ncbi:hypothetical protein A1Q2_01089 [Trichosporon asahii var. asahii CBS 8904]|uniref:Secreted protein n=1 Tax=Trichosporon asahii var. asahii (strain CBS 8904) TaxID=1220162 RepID=K1WUW8_TRIAC|nr:hypothetical protein A1Q2_01089 [Trichosporon asahii var. asahii CBS 8904]
MSPLLLILTSLRYALDALGLGHQANARQLEEHEEHRDSQEGEDKHENEARNRVQVNIGIVGVVVVMSQSAKGAQPDVPGVDDWGHG